jgi:ABC-type microcin C transport system permease subunit YejE
MSLFKGFVLGAANAILIALVLGVMEQSAMVSVLVIEIGGILGALAGALIGCLAGLTATVAPRWRVPLLALPAFGVVLFLAATFEMSPAAPIACVPTFVAALLLERWTRRSVPPPIPIATIRSIRA